MITTPPFSQRVLGQTEDSQFQEETWSRREDTWTR